MLDIHPTAFVAEGARLLGDVTIGPDSSVWYNAVLRGDEDKITVGARSNIQDGCVLHEDPGFPLTIGDGVTVGHNATLHGCTVGDGALVGMGATVLNGAVVGKRAMIAAGALVPQNMVIPDETLVVGCPAKVKRPLTPEEVVSLEESAQTYVNLSKRALAEQ